MLPHSQNLFSPHTLSWERKQEQPFPYQGHPTPAAHLPLWLSERQHLNCLLVYFPCQRQPLIGQEMENQGALVRSLHAWQRSLIQARPEQSVLVMQRSKDSSRGCILPCRSTGVPSPFLLPGPGTPVGPGSTAMSFLHWITAPKHSRTVWGKLYGLYCQYYEYWQEIQNNFRNFQQWLLQCLSHIPCIALLC